MRKRRARLAIRRRRETAPPRRGLSRRRLDCSPITAGDQKDARTWTWDRRQARAAPTARTERTWRDGISQQPLRNASRRPWWAAGLPHASEEYSSSCCLATNLRWTRPVGPVVTRPWRPAGANNSNHTILLNEQPTIK
ncbi:hypothetical protein PVAP13_3KG176854 [Panicum virgatum]|uniref:Uncharacterized protein n=1 Tax=Panicum virgatum TaxID=38727 RepID=A0A8T0URX0_PANVG|nr:hypothetical protein PVAP13_3KG176854 [Panicum virgatum]